VAVRAILASSRELRPWPWERTDVGKLTKKASDSAAAHKLLCTIPSRLMTYKWISVAAFLTALAGAGCAKTYIPNTDVQDNGENRGIITFCEKYRHAMEDRDVGTLLKLMSPAYFEDAGNVKGDDDADFDKIREFLMGDFLKTKGIRYEIRYRRITHTETHHVWVDYTYAGAWKIPGVKDDEWHHQVADNRLDLVRDGESYKIVSGM
jgi:hypothetical protein